MRLTDNKLYRSLVLNPELAAGEAYMDGTMTLRGGLGPARLHHPVLDEPPSLASYPLQNALKRSLPRPSSASSRRTRSDKAQKNVAHHYDLGNDFYALFLDRGMQYSCAYFLDEAETLEEAQRNKLRLIAAKLRLAPGQSVLDIGSGWGELASISPRWRTSTSPA